jgi:hypothetical protein
MDEEENNDSPLESRRVSRLCQSLSRWELTNVMAATCFSATDAMATAHGEGDSNGVWMGTTESEAEAWSRHDLNWGAFQGQVQTRAHYTDNVLRGGGG